jgi:hypothetical protein
MSSTMVYTSSRELTARREAAAEARFARVLANVRTEGEWFNAKVNGPDAKWRARDISAEAVARMVVDPETDIEYWPAS